MKSDSTYATHEADYNSKYVIQLQIAKYGDLKDITTKDIILYAGTDQDGCSIFYVIGQRQPTEKA